MAHIGDELALPDADILKFVDLLLLLGFLVEHQMGSLVSEGVAALPFRRLRVTPIMGRPPLSA